MSRNFYFVISSGSSYYSRAYVQVFHAFVLGFYVEIVVLGKKSKLNMIFPYPKIQSSVLSVF